MKSVSVISLPLSFLTKIIFTIFHLRLATVDSPSASVSSPSSLPPPPHSQSPTLVQDLSVLHACYNKAAIPNMFLHFLRAYRENPAFFPAVRLGGCLVNLSKFPNKFRCRIFLSQHEAALYGHTRVSFLSWFLIIDWLRYAVFSRDNNVVSHRLSLFHILLRYIRDLCSPPSFLARPSALHGSPAPRHCSRSGGRRRDLQQGKCPPLPQLGLSQRQSQ
jgi:hypothetical protein